MRLEKISQRSLRVEKLLGGESQILLFRPPSFKFRNVDREKKTIEQFISMRSE